MAKLSNLHTLELSGCYNLASLPPLNIVTLKLDRIINSLPINLRHLELLHVKRDCCDKCSDGNRLGQCLTRLVNLEMLSLTCYRIKSLPSMGGQRNLRVLLLKDCFALKELLPDLEQLVELHTLNISGTRIKSLPGNIMKLSKLQQLTLPKCFTQNLPMNLEEVSIIDDTDKRYYEHMGYYDSSYDSSYEGNDAAVGSVEGVDEAITEDPIQVVIEEQSCEQDDVISQIPRGSQFIGRKDLSDGYDHHAGRSSYNQDVEMHYICENNQQAMQNDGMGIMTEKNEQENAPCETSNLSCSEENQDNQSAVQIGQHMFPLSDNAKSKTQKLDLPQEKIQPLLSRNMRLVDAAKQLGVSRSTMKRKLKDYGINWPSNKRRKQCHEAKHGEPNIDSPCLEKPSIFAGHGHEQKGSKGATVTMAAVEKPPLEMEVHQHTKVHSDGTNQSNIAQPKGSLRTFDFVKACYKTLQVKIDISLTSSVDQLNESVSKKFGLMVNKFNIEYLDEDEEWYLMTSISDLDDALLHTSKSGKKFIRLSITDKGRLSTGQHSEENLQLLPTISKGRSTCLSIRFEKEKLKSNQCAGEKSTQAPNRFFIPLHESWVVRIKPLIEGHTDVKPDGNCGFRVIATFEYGDEEKWLDVRIDLLKELHTNKDLYKKALGGEEEFERANSMVSWFTSPAEVMHWFEATCLGLVVATKYQKVFTCWSNECSTYLPLVSRLVDHKPPTKYINMARINGNHFIALQMPTNIPLPPLSPLWKSHCCDTVKHWSTTTSIFKKQLDDYLQLRYQIQCQS